MEGLEGKGREEEGGLEGMPLGAAGAVAVRCGAGGAVSGICHLASGSEREDAQGGMGNEEGRASGGLLGVLAPEWHGAVQCGAVHHLPVPAPRRANGRRVLRRAALLISAGSWMALWRGKRSPEGDRSGRRHGGANRMPSPMRSPASESQPANQPASQPAS